MCERVATASCGAAAAMALVRSSCGNDAPSVGSDGDARDSPLLSVQRASHTAETSRMLTGQSMRADLSTTAAGAPDVACGAGSTDAALRRRPIQLHRRPLLLLAATCVARFAAGCRASLGSEGSISVAAAVDTIPWASEAMRSRWSAPTSLSSGPDAPNAERSKGISSDVRVRSTHAVARRSCNTAGAEWSPGGGGGSWATAAAKSVARMRWYSVHALAWSIDASSVSSNARPALSVAGHMSNFSSSVANSLSSGPDAAWAGGPTA